MKNWKVILASFSLLVALINSAQAANPNCDEVDGDFIVSFQRVVNVANEMRAAVGREIQTKFSYNQVLNGFAATLTGEQACAFKRRPGALVEKDRIASIDTSRPISQPGLWGLDRIDQTNPSLSNTLNIDSDGTGVNVYILDTGIYSKHSQFGGRVKSGYSTVGGGTEDCNGHGTHVAGTVGGSTYGVANNVWLFPVRVLGCNGSGSYSGIISGLDWVAANQAQSSRPGVASMSLGGGLSTSLNDAVEKLISNKVSVVVAAGNSTSDACFFSPASAPNAITVGATDKPTTSIDQIASYSNYGSCVDVYAPGTGIMSAWIKNTNATKTISGTSMATPHVTGIVARYLQLNPSAIPSGVVLALNSKSTAGITGSNINNKKMACLITDCDKT